MKKLVGRGTALFLVLLLSGICSGCQKGGGSDGLVLQVGQPAPGFTLKDTNGKPWRLSAMKGELVFVNFWATWCPPCRAEMPDMEALNRRLAGEKFRMVTILYQDSPEAAAQYVHEKGFTFPVLLDPDGSVARAYGITGVPETYLVDASGVLRDKFIGARNWNQNPQKAGIRRLLPRAPST